MFMIKKYIIYSIVSILFWGCNKQTDKVESNNIYHDDEDNNFSIGGSTKWSTTEITYSFGNSFPNKDNFKNAIRNAFLTWGNSSSNIKFKEISSNAEIRIEMGGIEHLGCPIDFEEDKLAHGFYPPPDQEYGDFAGDLHFYNKWNWTTDGTSNYDIETSALHEIGHILGLGHSSIQQSVMFRRYSGIRKTLSQDDKDAICQLYGCNNSNNLPNQIVYWSFDNSSGIDNNGNTNYTYDVSDFDFCQGVNGTALDKKVYNLNYNKKLSPYLLRKNLKATAFSFWIKKYSYPDWVGFLNDNKGSGSTISNTNFAFLFSDSIAPNTLTVRAGVNCSGFVFQDLNYHHVVINLDMNEMALYIDGQFVIKSNSSYNSDLPKFESYQFLPNGNASIDQFRIFDDKLNSDNIKYLFENKL